LITFRIDSLPEIYQTSSTSEERRLELNSAMRGNEAKGFDCKNCTGTCCTFAHNTMHVSPLEAVDILVNLEQKKLIDDALIKHLEITIKNYQLDRPMMGNGKSELYRRSYTCPFFGFKGWGCGLSVTHKPLGCIAFNPIETGIQDGGSCRSQTSELAQHRIDWEDQEGELNRILKDHFQLDWEKKDIPSALLDLLQA
jgi:Fe-S-cluster containining protein